MDVAARVEAAAATSDLLRAVASVTADGGLLLALDDAPLRALTQEEIAILEGSGSSSTDWSRVRVASGFQPSAVRGAHFFGDVVLGQLRGAVRLAQGLQMPAGVYQS